MGVILGASGDTTPVRGTSPPIEGSWGEGPSSGAPADDNPNIFGRLIENADTPEGGALLAGILLLAAALILCCIWLLCLLCGRKPFHAVWLNPPTHSAVRATHRFDLPPPDAPVDMSILISPGTVTSTQVTKTVTQETHVDAAGVGVVKKKIRTKIPFSNTTETVVATSDVKSTVITQARPGIMRIKHRTKIQESNTKTTDITKTQTKTTTKPVPVAQAPPAYVYEYVDVSASDSGYASTSPAPSTASLSSGIDTSSALDISSSTIDSDDDE